MDIRNFFAKKGEKKPDAKKNTSAASKKRLVIQDSDDVKTSKKRESEKREVSSQDFFANAASKTKESKPEPAKKDPTKTPNFFNDSEEEASPRKKPKIVLTEILDDTDDDSSTPKLASSPDTPKAPPPKKRAAEPRKASPRKKTSVTPPKAPKKSELLQPELKLDSLDVDTATTQCLEGLTFCFTGILDDLDREQATEYVKILGGRVTGNVSSKTHYVVLGGVLEDGRAVTDGKKYQRAVSEGTVLINGTSHFYGLLKQYSDEKGGTSAAPSSKPVENSTVALKAAVPTPPPKASVPEPSPKATVKDPPPAAAAAKPIVNPYAKKTTNPYATKSSNPYAAKKMPVVNDDRKPAAVKPVGVNDLWVDKYKPTNSKEILGNQESVRKLSMWLASWEQRFNSARNVNKTFSNPNGPWKAALLSGPPGIGTQESGRDVLEFNASDVRSKKALHDQVGDITGSNTLQFGGAKLKRCIIMDEVDGMGAGDRSGMSELIAMIKKSRVPVICICNDRQSQKIKSLLPYCMDLRFRRPVKSVIASRALQVAQEEGLQVERNAVEAIAESCGNDVRQVLNCLQMWASNHTTNLTYKNLRERERSINKDEILRVSLFDATRVLVEGRRGVDSSNERQHWFRRHDAYFVDYNFLGLMVQQNYLKVLQTQFTEAKRKNENVLAVLERTHDAAASLSDWAMMENSLRGEQNWSLLPASAALAVKVGYHAGGESGGFLPGFPEFTTWLGRNSSSMKKSRLLNELNHHMNYKVPSSTQLRLSYVPVLQEHFGKLLYSGQIEEAIQLMDEYGLDRDDVLEKLDEFGFDKKQTFDKLDSKTRAALTRTYNARSHKSQALVAEQGATKKKRKTGAATETTDPDAINDDDDIVEPEEDSVHDDEEDAEKIKTLFKSKGRKGTKKNGGVAKAKKNKTKK